MFFQGAPRILKANVNIPGLRKLSVDRHVVEAYPGVLVRQIIENSKYKTENKNDDSDERKKGRRDILKAITEGGLSKSHGISVKLNKKQKEQLFRDYSGDLLDALLCAIQAAWSWSKRDENFGVPDDPDTKLEGWIADPMPNARMK